MNPNLLTSFAGTGTKEGIPAILQDKGWSPTNPNVHGYQLNELFFQLFGFANHIKKKGLSFYDGANEDYVAFDEAEGTEADMVRDGNKIYFCIQANGKASPKAPATNPLYWEVFFDFDKPIYKEIQKYSEENHNHDSEYAKKEGNSKQVFSVENAIDDNHAVNKKQMELAVANKESSVLQVAYSELTTSGVGNNPMPNNGETPFYTDGTHILSCSITPKNKDSDLLIIVNTYVGEVVNSGDEVYAAVFRNNDQNAIVAKGGIGQAGGIFNNLTLSSLDMQRRIPSVNTNPTIFKLRVGANAGACRWNGVSGTHVGGDAGITSMLIMEVL